MKRIGDGSRHLELTFNRLKHANLQKQAPIYMFAYFDDVTNAFLLLRREHRRKHEVMRNSDEATSKKLKFKKSIFLRKVTSR